MSMTDLEKEIQFGLGNLAKISERVSRVRFLDIDKDIKISALTYECFGYYNALEHLILRFIKYLKLDIPQGAFSHKENIKKFRGLLKDYEVEVVEETLDNIIDLMAFRHVATKIYGFLIDENKLNDIAGKIEREHSNIVEAINRLLIAVGKRESQEK